MILDDRTLVGVKELVRINIDSAKGFRTAADQVETPDIAIWFRQCSERRAGFAEELRRFVRMNDAEADDSGTFAGALHRWWIDIRGTIQAGDEYAMLAEAERGEDAIKSLYEKVIAESVGTPATAVLIAQHRSVKADHDAVKALRDSTKAK